MGVIPAEVVIAKPGYFWVYFEEWMKEKVIPWRNRYIKQLLNKKNTATIFDIGDCGSEIQHIKNVATLKLKRVFRFSLAVWVGFLNFGGVFE